MLCYAKSLQSCPTLCDPIDGSPPGSPVPGILQARTCHFLLQCMKVTRESEVAQSCPTLSDPMDCSLPGCSINGIFQARVLEWGTIAFSGFLPYIDMNQPWVYMCPPSWTPLPPPSPYHPSGSSLYASILQPVPSNDYPASNLNWQFVSYMILYMFQWHSSKSSHPFPLPQNPKDCTIYLCLFCCLIYRVIVTIILNSIYMR